MDEVPCCGGWLGRYSARLHAEAKALKETTQRSGPYSLGKVGNETCQLRVQSPRNHKAQASCSSSGLVSQNGYGGTLRHRPPSLRVPFARRDEEDSCVPPRRARASGARTAPRRWRTQSSTHCNRTRQVTCGRPNAPKRMKDDLLVEKQGSSHPLLLFNCFAASSPSQRDCLGVAKKHAPVQAHR